MNKHRLNLIEDISQKYISSYMFKSFTWPIKAIDISIEQKFPNLQIGWRHEGTCHSNLLNLIVATDNPPHLTKGLS